MNLCNIYVGKDLNRNILQDKGYPIYSNSINNKGLIGYYNDYQYENCVTVTSRGNIGTAVYRKNKFNAVGRLLVLTSGLNNYFLAESINNINILIESTGVPQLTAPQLGNYKINYPNNINEQIKIAQFLSFIDEKIETQSKIIEKLKVQNKYISNYIFTKFDNTILLKDICFINKGQQFNISNLKEKGNYYLMNGGVNPSGFLDQYNKKENTISISEGGNSCGYVHYHTNKFWSGGHCYTLDNVSKKIDNKFLYYFLKNREKNIMNLKIGSGLPNIQKKDIENIKIPNIKTDEQKIIVSILDSINNKINNEINISNHYIDLKKYLLNNLFC